MKKFLTIFGIILLVLVAGMIVIVVMDNELRNITINEVDLTKVSDGVYSGSFKSWRMNNDVEVTLKDHTIVDIKNLKEMPDDRSQQIVDKAIEMIIEKQTVQIDVISGSSYNTKSFQKAVENALTDGLVK